MLRALQAGLARISIVSQTHATPFGGRLYLATRPVRLPESPEVAEAVEEVVWARDFSVRL